MRENQELIDNEELKRFLLREAIILCPSIKEETSEGEKLQMLYRTQKRMNKLLSLLYHCDLGMHYVELYEVFGFYFVEKEGEKRKKHRMSVRLDSYSQFICQLMGMKDLIISFYIYNRQYLKVLEKVMNFYYPEDLLGGGAGRLEQLTLNTLKEGTEK